MVPHVYTPTGEKQKTELLHNAYTQNFHKTPYPHATPTRFKIRTPLLPPHNTHTHVNNANFISTFYLPINMVTPDEEDDLVQTNITIRRSQREWVEKTAINLSKFVRNKLAEEMAKQQAVDTIRRI